MPWKCPVCGHVNPDDKEFCEVCGAKRPDNPEQLKLEEPRQEQPQPEQAEALEQQPSEAGEATEAPEPVTEQAAEEEAGPTEEEETPPAAAPEKPVEEKPAPTTPETIYLEIVNAPAQELIGKRIPVMLKVFPQVTIGRSPENVIIIPDPTVSRKHAAIKVEEGKIVLEDLGSTNGTYVYSQETGSFEKIEKIELKPGMIIRLGEQTIIKITAELA
ncbi:FHA domain-containing protein [Pyrofollis japonicus]|uniref:FHA domain-containing protein n=1 Tax=Pyrofollis japonicus TaxID=3060460 RepID=UPI00295BCC5E|nr:FHA domain-containing protein [Pyrofollis japonicus]BEP16858.1 FHA domain-containing protein [Pyrofollis japonicus]